MLLTKGMFKDKIATKNHMTEIMEKTFEQKMRVNPIGHGRFEIYSNDGSEKLATVTIEGEQ